MEETRLQPSEARWPSEDLNMAMTIHPKDAKDLLFIVFVHGFRGSAMTFEPFPDRLQGLLSNSKDTQDVEVKCTVYRTYKTRGELKDAVRDFKTWLMCEVAELEKDRAGKAKIVLCGHSMGGLVVADTLIAMVEEKNSQIIACIAYDTPYFGLHPEFLTHEVMQLVEKGTRIIRRALEIKELVGYIRASLPVKGTETPPEKPASSVVDTPDAEPPTDLVTDAPAEPPAADTPDTPAELPAADTPDAPAEEDSWRSNITWYIQCTIAFLVACVAGWFIYKWALEHLQYVGSLFSREELHKRVEGVLAAQDDTGVIFRTFYTEIPASPDKPSRNFIQLPSMLSKSTPYFTAAPNSRASNEIGAHTGMFGVETNAGYDDLEKETIEVIRKAMNNRRRGVV